MKSNNYAYYGSNENISSLRINRMKMKTKGIQFY